MSIPSPDHYRIERFESRDWLLRKRFGWRIVSNANGEIILSSNQGHSRQIDRDQVANRFAEATHIPPVRSWA